MQNDDKKRLRKYGDVRPIIHAKFQGYDFVAVGSELHYSKKWKTFPDFLQSYLATKLGKDWGNAEIQKPLKKRHQIMQWYDAMCHFQRKQKKDSDGIYKVTPNGAYSAYILLAYDLYVLKDNRALQDDIIRRLKIPAQFQGARHELFATATCIRAGYSIEFENEKDGSKKHTEFIGSHKKTNQKIAVEAKSKHRPGVLGFPGEKRAEEKVKLSVTSLINSAINKYPGSPLVIFVDTNLPPRLAQKAHTIKQPSDEFKIMADRIKKDSTGKDLFSLIVLTNHPHAYGDDNEDDPSRHTTSIFATNPKIVPHNNRCIIALNEAARQHGSVPNEFPEKA